MLTSENEVEVFSFFLFSGAICVKLVLFFLNVRKNSLMKTCGIKMSSESIYL